MKRIFAALVLFSLLLGLCACGKGSGTQTEPDVTAPADPNAPAALAEAVYPEMAQYPLQEGGDFDAEAYNAWREGVKARQAQAEGYADGLENYLRSVLTEFLPGGWEENRVCAPMNIYLALGMLAELTEGESRAQVLSLLGAEDISALRMKARAIWNAEYRDDGLVTCRLASSLWLNKDVSFVQETMDALAEIYCASSFRGEMGSPEFDKTLQDWLNRETGDLLKDQTARLHLDPRTVLALATSVYYKAPWEKKFSREGTYAQTFYSLAGEEETDFLHRSYDGYIYWGDIFTAVDLDLGEDGGTLWIILPDEGYLPEELLSGEAMDFLVMRNKYAWNRYQYFTVNLALPRFDVSSDTDLIPGLQDLGVRDVFDLNAADFTPMTTDKQVFLSQVQHAARLMIDEDGCTGAAYTVIAAPEGAMPPEIEVDFTADRPFLFMLTGAEGLPLFTGIVNTTK